VNISNNVSLFLSFFFRNGFDVEGWNEGPEGCMQTLLHKAIDENKEDAGAFLIRRWAT
jgi:hypothetical protein